MNDEKRILEMIEQGKITAAEGLELLNALKSKKTQTTTSVDLTKTEESNRKFKYIRVVVETEKETKVNVNIPLNLIKAIGGITSQISSFIPEHAKKEMDEKGVNLGNIDFDALIEALESGQLEDRNLVDVTANDEKEGLVKVKVYVE